MAAPCENLLPDIEVCFAAHIAGTREVLAPRHPHCRLWLTLATILSLVACGGGPPANPSGPDNFPGPNLAGSWELFKDGHDDDVTVLLRQSGGSLTATFTHNEGGEEYASGTGSVTPALVFTLQQTFYVPGQPPCDWSGNVDTTLIAISGTQFCRPVFVYAFVLRRK